MCSSQQHPLFKNGWPLEPWVEDPLLKTCDLLSVFFVPQLLRPFVVRGECWRLEYTTECWRVDTKYTVMMGWKRKGYSKLHHFFGFAQLSREASWNQFFSIFITCTSTCICVVFAFIALVLIRFFVHFHVWSHFAAIFGCRCYHHQPRNIAKNWWESQHFVDLQGTSKTSTSGRMPHHSNYT